MTIKAELDSAGLRVQIDIPWRYKDLCKSIPGVSWDAKTSIWSMPVSWSGCLALRSTFRDELEIGPRLSEWASHERASRIDPSNVLREATEFPGGAPDLFPHQQAGVEFLATAKRALLADEPGLGKALANSELVLTPTGFVPIDTLKIGDQVIGANGQATDIVGVYPQGARDIYCVEFSDGSNSLVDLDHLWQVESVRTRGPQVATTEWLVEQGLTQKNGKKKYRIPMVAPVVFAYAKEPLPIPAYVLGNILGGGSCSRTGSVRLTTTDIETAQRIRLAGQVVKWDGKKTYALKGIAANIRALGLAGHAASNKFIPNQYLRASVSDRKNILRGLMDSNGQISSDGTVVQFFYASHQLADGVAELVQSLGGTAQRSYRPDPQWGNFPVFTLTIETLFNPFLLERKASLWRSRKKASTSRYINSVKYSHVEEATCIRVSAEDHLFVMREYVVTHNTAQAIRGIAKLYERGEDVFPVLVICPNTLKKNWEREFALWWPGIRVQVIGGTAVQRRKQFAAYTDPQEGDPQPHVLVMNWESLRTHSRLERYGSISLARCPACGGENGKVSETRCEVHKRELNEIDFKSVIADEIHRSKEPKSKQTRALWSASGDAQIRFALTGTPIANNVVDLWPILHWLEPKEWPSKTRWIDRMVDVMLNTFGGMLVLGIKPHMRNEFYQGVNPRMRRMLKAVVLPWLPEVTVERRDVEMSTKQKKAYNDMRDFMIAELEGGEALSAPSVLTQTIRLLQLASSYATLETDPTTGVVTTTLVEPSCKIDALMDDITHGDFGEDSIAVTAVSRQLIELLSARLTKAGIAHGLITGKQNADERQQAVDDFQGGKIKWILFTAQAGGVGITLTAARRLIRLQRPWSLVDDKQVNDRVHRIGSEIHDNIIITDYVTAGTAEERVREVLEGKADSFEQVVNDKAQLLKMLKDEKAAK